MLRRAGGSRLVTAALGVIATTLVAWGQEPSPQEPPSTIKVEVKQVLVPVIVTDRRGHHVTGLAARDFRVFEEGVEQQIVAFGTETLDAPTALPAANSATPAAPPLPAPPPRRTYVICLDALNSSFANFFRVREALSKLFQQERSTHSQYGLLVLGRGVIVVKYLTPRGEDILAAMGSKELDRAVLQSETANFAEQERHLGSLLDKYCNQCGCGGFRSTKEIDKAMDSSGICGGMLNYIMNFAASAARERSLVGRQFIRNLRTLTEQLGQQPGKRTLLLVSDGFSLWAGRDLYAAIGAYLGTPAVIQTNPGEMLGPEIEELAQLASSLNVSIYTLDSRGLAMAPTFGVFDADGEHASLARSPQALGDLLLQAPEKQDGMRLLATTTGGVFVGNSNDLLRGMRQAFADGREYYVLAYVPTNRAADGQFRKIRVEVKDKKLTVRAKQGYWAPRPLSLPPSSP
jgi:VWFA-related protein